VNKAAPADERQLPYETFLARARHELAFKTASHVRLFNLAEADWDADLVAGTITFTSPQVVMTSPVQVVGTYNLLDSTWLWGWDHPSVSEPLARAAEVVRQYGEQSGVVSLTTRKLSCSEKDAWDFTALACKLYGGQGAYRGPDGDALVFFVYEQVNIRKAALSRHARALNGSTALANHLFSIAALVSALAFCAIVVTWVAAGRIDPRRQFIRISNACHISVDARGADARLEVFNDATYGPYSGSIIGIVGDPNGPTVSGVGDVAGIYYRMIAWPNGTTLWTLSLSLAYPLLLAAVLPVVWLTRRSRRPR
jgi:hypothetical protein